jgi:adenylyltransferase/sulfurtransferase
LERDNIKMQLGCPDVAIQEIIRGRIPTTSISASIIGALQVQEALKLLPDAPGKSLLGRSITYEGLSSEWIDVEQTPAKESCFRCALIDDITPCPLDCRSTLGALLDWAEQSFEGQSVSLMLRHPLVLKIGTTVSKKIIEGVCIPKTRLKNALLKNFLSSEDDEVRVLPQEGAERVVLDKQFPDQEATLINLGIPPKEVVQLIVDGQPKHVLLNDSLEATAMNFIEHFSANNSITKHSANV